MYIDGSYCIIPAAFAPSGLNQNPPVHQVTGAVTASVTTISLAALGAPFADAKSIRLVVSGNDPVAFAYGTRAGLTLDNGAYMIGNTVESFKLPANVSVLSVISSGTASTLRVHVGEGA